MDSHVRANMYFAVGYWIPVRYILYRSSLTSEKNKIYQYKISVGQKVQPGLNKYYLARDKTFTTGCNSADPVVALADRENKECCSLLFCRTPSKDWHRWPWPNRESWTIWSRTYPRKPTWKYPPDEKRWFLTGTSKFKFRKRTEKKRKWLVQPKDMIENIWSQCEAVLKSLDHNILPD